ncbi:MAG: VTT domain-containing protein [Magnetococcus sp. YQC-5]
MFFMRDLVLRLRRKMLAVLPILIGAALLSVLLAGVGYLLMYWGPTEWSRQIVFLTETDFVTSKTVLKEFFLSYQDKAALVFLGIQLLQVLLAPIPGQLAGLLGGFVFGFWQGLLLTMFGVMLGSWVAMGLSRLIGVYVVRRFVPVSVMKKFDYLLSQGTLFDFFIIYLLPALPDDAICFIAGMTRWSLWRLLMVCFLGRLPGMAVLTFAGSSLDTHVELARLVFGLAMAIAVLVWLYDDQLENWVKRSQSK